MSSYIFVPALAILLCLIALYCYRSALQQHRLRQLSGLENACRLLTLMKAIQQHRGVSSGILGGKQDQQGKLTQLSRLTDQQIQTLAPRLNDDSFDLWHKIIPQWQQIQQNWQHADVLDNFEQHCDLLHDIHSLIMDVTDHCGLTSSHRMEEQVLAGEIFGHLPALIENIGQLRALSTHAAASHDCITAFRLHLQYLMDQLQQQKNQLGKQSQHKHDSLIEGVNGLLCLVQQEILEAEQIHIDPERLFQRATLVMDNCFESIDKGVKHIKQSQFV